MKTLSTRAWLGLALTLIVLSNAVALVGVYYNRSGTPQSLLTLSERELYLPYGDWLHREDNSGLRLELMWRQANETGQLDWLHESKLRALGFRVPADGAERFSRQLARPVWLVLELDGPAYRRQVQRAQHALVEAQERVQARPDDQELQRQRDVLREQQEQEERYASRLFLIDAGLDAEALRAQYPDRQRHVLLAGRLKPYHRSGNTGPHYTASIQAEISRISVPPALRAAFAGWQQGVGYREGRLRVQAQVAFGQRHEPWMIGATR